MVFKLFGEAQELLDTNTLNQRSWNMFFFSFDSRKLNEFSLEARRNTWPSSVASLHPFGFPRKADAQQHKGEASHWLLTGSEEGIKNVLQLPCWATWGQCFIRNSTERQASGKPSDQVFGEICELNRRESSVPCLLVCVSLLFIKRQLGVIKTGF